MRSYAKLHEVTRSYAKLLKVTQSYAKLRKITQSYAKLRKVTQCYAKLLDICTVQCCHPHYTAVVIEAQMRVARSMTGLTPV